MLGTLNNGSNGELLAKARPDLAPNRESQFGTMKIHHPICQFALATGIFSMLACSGNFPVDDFNQVMVMAVRLQLGGQSVVDIIVFEISIKCSYIGCHCFTILTGETALLWVGHRVLIGAKKERRIKVNVETPVICKEPVVKWFVNNIDGLACQRERG